MRQRLETPLIQRHRRLARFLLYLVPIALGVLGWAVVTTLSYFKLDESWKKVDYTQYESVRLFQRYLQINTSYPTGNEIPGAEFLARELEKEGITAHVERLGHRNANVWAVLEGSDPRALVLHNHIDVDPITSPKTWRRPPMSGLIDLPYVYGRGAFDMKSLAIAQLMAVKNLRREGRSLSRSLVFLATGDEERDSWHGTRWILSQHPELVERFDVVLSEGGAVEATDIDIVKFWGTESRQKLYVDVWVCGSNEDALKALMEDLRQPELMTRGHPERLPGVVVEDLRGYLSSRQRSYDFLLSFESALAWRGGYGSLPPIVRAMMRHDLSAFPVFKDPAGGYTMRLILQLLHWESIESAIESVLPGGLPGFSYTIDIPHGPIPSEGLAHPIFDHIDARMKKALSRGRAWLGLSAVDRDRREVLPLRRDSRLRLLTVPHPDRRCQQHHGSE